MEQFRALLYLEARTLVNSVKNTFRSPKKWIPAASAALIFGGMIVGAVAAGIMLRAEPRFHFTLNPAIQKNLWGAAFFFLLLISIQTVIQAFRGGSLAFLMSDVDFLFPSPVPRRLVLAVKLIKFYLVQAVMMFLMSVMFLSVPLGMIGKGILPGVLIIWVAVTALFFAASNVSHTLNILLTYHLEKLKWVSRGLKVLLYGLSGLAVAGLIWAGSAAAVGFTDFIKTGSFFEALDLISDSLILRIVFLPITWTADLVVNGVMRFSYWHVLQMLFLIGLAAASHYVLINRPENFYEPSLGASEKMSRIISAVREGNWMSALASEQMARSAAGKKQRTLIPSFGHGAVAVVWKNLVTSLRVIKPVQLVTFFAILAFLSGVRTKIGGGDGRNIHIILVYVLFFGLQISLSEARKEIRRDMLKTLPMTGWKLMLAQAVSQAIPMIVLIVVMMLVVGSASGGSYLLRLWLMVVPSMVLIFTAGGVLSIVLFPSQPFLSWIMTMLLSGVPMTVSAVAVMILALTRFSVPVYTVAAVVVPFNLATAAVMIAIAGKLYERYDPASD